MGRFKGVAGFFKKATNQVKEKAKEVGQHLKGAGKKIASAVVPTPTPKTKTPITFTELISLISKKPSDWKEFLKKYEISDLSSIKEADKAQFIKLIGGLNEKNKMPLLALLGKETVLKIINNIELFEAVMGVLQKQDQASFMALIDIAVELKPIIKNVMDLLTVLSMLSVEEQIAFMSKMDAAVFLTVVPDANRLSELFSKLAVEVVDKFKSRPDYKNIILPGIVIVCFQAEIAAYQKKLASRKESASNTKKSTKLQELMGILTIEDENKKDPEAYAQALGDFVDAFNDKATQKLFTDSLSGLRKVANLISFGRHKQQLTPYKKTFIKNVKGVISNPNAFFQRYHLEFNESAEMAAAPAPGK